MLQWLTVIKGILSYAVVSFIIQSTNANTKGELNRFLSVLVAYLLNR